MEGQILIIDNNKIFADGLKYSLEQDNYKVDIIESGKEGLNKLKRKEYDLILLELDLLDIDGLEICKSIRGFSFTPIIIISEQDDDISKVIGLEYGADDYVVKPFNFVELKARIKSILRRVGYERTSNNNYIFEYDNFSINTLRRRISIEDRNVDLTEREFELFYTLSTNPGKVFTREELLEKVWGYKDYGDVRTVDVHIRRIREKIEKDKGNSQYIMTKWGVGYYFTNM